MSVLSSGVSSTARTRRSEFTNKGRGAPDRIGNTHNIKMKEAPEEKKN
jgi:hypothetical protein